MITLEFTDALIAELDALQNGQWYQERLVQPDAPEAECFLHFRSTRGNSTVCTTTWHIEADLGQHQNLMMCVGYYNDRLGWYKKKPQWGKSSSQARAAEEWKRSSRRLTLDQARAAALALIAEQRGYIEAKRKRF